ncbi:MAG: aldehyde dehydrogenase family protein, partial [Pseudomonadota bacterium]|nr:aldehyde dehydrogenase family protein [Pseudomonadota bacterium]
MNATLDPKVRMQAVLELQKAAHLREGPPSAELRVNRLNRCIKILIENSDAIAEALNTDFGNRPKESTGVTDVAGSIGPLKHARDHLKTWMKTEKRKPTPALLGLFGAKAEVRYQPKGVVGVIAPWN